MPAKKDDSSKDRLLLAASNLMQVGAEFSTRDILAAAKVTAPTLYHHFGSKQGLVDAVASHGFSQYVASRDPEAGPLDSIRHGWDRHVEFGLDHPGFYARLYGDIEPGRPCAVTSPAIDMMLLILEPAAADGVLTAAPLESASRILAANVGVTLSLIAQPEDERDLELSVAVREAIIDSITHGQRPQGNNKRDVAAQAVALGAHLQTSDLGLSEGERGLLLELLNRVATSEMKTTTTA